MRYQDAPLLGAAELLTKDHAIRFAYEELIGILERSGVPPQEKAKSKPSFVYDQTKLQSAIRRTLRSHGWTQKIPLAPEVRLASARVPAIESDMIKDQLQVILEFGNRASFFANFLSRFAFGVASRKVRLTVFVTPTYRFAGKIDANLANFERITAEVGRLATGVPTLIPGPLVMVGVEPELA